MTTDTVREFLGWCTIINSGILLFQAVAVMCLRKTMTQIHGSMFGLDEPSLMRCYFQYLALYKIAILVFNLVPFLALLIVG
ncbi:MAG: DUF6868 family protein [Verrucomicrobiales bacterium]